MWRLFQLIVVGVSAEVNYGPLRSVPSQVITAVFVSR